MSETNTALQQAAVELPTDAGLMNAFDDSNWSDKPFVNPGEAQPTPTTQATPETKPSEEEIVDADAYLKEHLGFDSWESAKAEVENLRKLKDAPPTKEELKFENEQSKLFFEAIKSGKKDEVYSYLERENKLSRAEQLDATKPDEAAEIIKLNLQLKNNELTAKEIDFIFKRDYSIPKKPVQSDDQTDEEYAQSVNSWKERVSEVETSMSIAAKLAKPDLKSFHSALTLPDIPSAAPAAAEPTPEELAQVERLRSAYLQDVNKGLVSTKGFQAEFKDEEVSYPVSYEITAEEKLALKPVMESLFTDFGYFGKRWSNADGTYNTALMAEDLYLLENKSKVFQKFANESGAQRLAHKIKADSNIQLTRTPQQTFNPTNQQSELEKMAGVFFQ